LPYGRHCRRKDGKALKSSDKHRAGASAWPASEPPAPRGGKPPHPSPKPSPTWTPRSMRNRRRSPTAGSRCRHPLLTDSNRCATTPRPGAPTARRPRSRPRRTNRRKRRVRRRGSRHLRRLRPSGGRVLRPGGRRRPGRRRFGRGRRKQETGRDPRRNRRWTLLGVRRRFRGGPPVPPRRRRTGRPW
jgi:hypothetical protein